MDAFLFEHARPPDIAFLVKARFELHHYCHLFAALGGYLVARAPNPFASVCGRVCAAPCEDACRRGAIDAPITIRALKRFLTEQYGVESTQPDTQDCLRTAGVSEGNQYPGHLPVSPLVFHRAAPASGCCCPWLPSEPRCR